MNIMLLRNDNDSVNKSSCGLVVYRITTIPSWHNFHIKETQLDILYIMNSGIILLFIQIFPYPYLAIRQTAYKYFQSTYIMIRFTRNTS